MRLRSYKVRQMAEYNTLEDGNRPKSDHNHIDHFESVQGVMK